MRLSKENKVTKASIPVVKLESFEVEKESYLDEKLKQNIAADNKCNNHSPQPKVDRSVNSVLIDSDKESSEP